MEFLKNIGWEHILPRDIARITEVTTKALRKYRHDNPQLDIGLLATPFVPIGEQRAYTHYAHMQKIVEIVTPSHSFAQQGRLISTLDFNNFLLLELCLGKNTIHEDLGELFVTLIEQKLITDVIMLPQWRKSKTEVRLQNIAEQTPGITVHYHENPNTGLFPPIQPLPDPNDPKILS